MAKKSVAHGSLAKKPVAKKIGGERGSGESCNTKILIFPLYFWVYSSVNVKVQNLEYDFFFS